MTSAAVIMCMQRGKAPTTSTQQCSGRSFSSPSPSGHDARLPAPAIVAARERAGPVNELMVRIGLPVWRLASAGDDHARSVRRHPAGDLHGRRQVHQQGHRAQHALRVVDEPDQLAQVGLAAQVDHVPQGGMLMPGLADLHEEDPVPRNGRRPPGSGARPTTWS